MDCIFCKIIAGELPSHKIYEDESVIAILNIYPVCDGHALVIPKAHATDLLETSEADALAMMRAIKKITPAILQSLGADGCNLGMNNGASAGQEIAHTHIHIMPRKTGEPRNFEKTTGDHAKLAALAETIRQAI